jgi:hypothetical protein
VRSKDWIFAFSEAVAPHDVHQAVAVVVEGRRPVEAEAGDPARLADIQHAVVSRVQQEPGSVLHPTAEQDVPIPVVVDVDEIAGIGAEAQRDADPTVGEPEGSVALVSVVAGVAEEVGRQQLGPGVAVVVLEQ